jgi:stage V sporulation protein S
MVRESGRAEVQAIGAGAVNQATKAVVIARGYLARDGFEVVFIPSFAEINIDRRERTAIRMVVEAR